MIRKTLFAPVLFAGAALAIATAPAMAATTAPSHAATRAVPAKPAVPAKKVAVAKRTTPRGKSSLVTTRLANGKTVTYDCHLAGNKAKTACKGKG